MGFLMGNSAGAPRTPSIAGTLATRPLAELFVHVRTRRLTGRLVVRTPDGRGGMIDLWRGQIIRVRTNPPVAYLGAVALELGLADEKAIESARTEATEKKKLHGEILVERKVLTAAQRDGALTEQAFRKLEVLFLLSPTTAFAFYDEKPSAAEPPFTLDPIAPVWRALRDSPESVALRTALAPLGMKALRIVNEAPIARVVFATDEKKLCQALVDRPMTLSEMQTAFASIPFARLERLAYLLILTGTAELVRASRAALPATTVFGSRAMTSEAVVAALEASRRQTPTTLPLGGSVAPPGARPVSDAPVALGSVIPPGATLGPSELGVAGIVRRAENVEDEESFATLGLEPDASVDVVRATYLRLVKAWHPDRVPADLASVKTEVAKIFAQITSAHHTLTDADARRAYLAAREERAAIIRNRPRAEVLRLIDMALSTRDFAFAESECRRLSALHPNDADVQAIFAWTAAQAGEGPDSTLRAAVQALGRALENEADCVRARFYRGVLHKRLGDADLAYRDFARVVRVDPKHVDATREVRIYEMRHKK
jgi:curved DNA-binding protein CbpA